MAEVLEKRETTPSLLQVPERRVIRMRSPSRGRSQTPMRGRSMTPLQLFREGKEGTPSVWRSITPFLSREDKEKTPFEIGTNILQQLASYSAIIDRALVMDLSLEEDEQKPAKFILSEHSVIDRAAVMDLSNVEIIYVEDDDLESDYRESETPESMINESHAVSVYKNVKIVKSSSKIYKRVLREKKIFISYLMIQFLCVCAFCNIIEISLKLL